MQANISHKKGRREEEDKQLRKIGDTNSYEVQQMKSIRIAFIIPRRQH